jgi:predicted regulator of Ras-like GTPase activity (Roadblock/LC7/MglB family)
MMRVVEAWVGGPLLRFRAAAHVEAVLLLRPDGQVLAQEGFGRPSAVMSACALAAAIHAAAGALGRDLDGQAFREVHFAGAHRQFYLTRLASRTGPLLLLAVFGADGSLGLVRAYLDDLRQALADGGGVPAEPPADLERALDRSLAALFGGAPR